MYTTQDVQACHQNGAVPFRTCRVHHNTTSETLRSIQYFHRINGRTCRCRCRCPRVPRYRGEHCLTPVLEHQWCNIYSRKYQLGPSGRSPTCPMYARLARSSPVPRPAMLYLMATACSCYSLHRHLRPVQLLRRTCRRRFQGCRHRQVLRLECRPCRLSAHTPCNYNNLWLPHRLHHFLAGHHHR